MAGKKAEWIQNKFHLKCNTVFIIRTQNTRALIFEIYDIVGCRHSTRLLSMFLTCVEYSPKCKLCVTPNSILTIFLNENSDLFPFVVDLNMSLVLLQSY